MNKIVVIGVYFGCFPNYFPLWLESAYRNKSIDFLIFTDQCNFKDHENVRFINLEMNKFEKMISHNLEINAHIVKPYKCCDFKPVYGIIFSDYIRGYDYWGHCDFDLLFGDIQYFLDKYELYKYDKFLALGHLSFYRNCAEVSERYKLSGAATDYSVALQSSENFYFDELAGISAIYIKHGFPMFSKRIFADISPIYKRYKFSDYYYLDDKPQNYKFQTFYWDNGKTWHLYVDKNKQIQREEYMYIHFQKRPNYIINDDFSCSNRIYVTNCGFISTADESVNLIKELNRNYGLIIEKMELFKFIIKQKYNGALRRIKRILK